MTFTQWFIFFLVLQLIHFAGTWKLYLKAGRKAWEAAVPFYNAIVLMQIIKRPKWWVILLFVPIVNLIMFPVVWVETARSFGKTSKWDTALCVLTLGFYLFYLNYVEISRLNYRADRSLIPKTSSGEWTSSILFAVVAATIVHTYVMQPFTIPSSSLEKTLLVGDFLFVSKFHYGARIPMTTVAAPMVHDTVPALPLPFTGIKLTPKFKSYLSHPQLPYMRLPGFQDIERNDIVVFNKPVDTMLTIDYTDKYYYKPIDKKTNLVKRCVAIPGDTLEFRNGFVYIDGEPNDLPDRARLQFSYEFEVKGEGFDQRIFELLRNRYDITDGLYQEGNKLVLPAATAEAAEQFSGHPSVANLKRRDKPQGEYDPSIFPNDPQYPWNVDWFGPLYVPEKGATVTITQKNIPLYKRIIEVYDGSELGIDNTVTLSGTEVLLNGAPLTEYTFKQDYYWMVGDNRDNSLDARTWGFVPYNHVVGKPVFIWMSWDGSQKGIQNKVRWERLFTTVGGDGQPVSYFTLFIGLLVAYFVFSYIRKRRKKA
ncbi:signal peptidase I [Croceiramulus getboli]|nr:signal peptidase I [Flavobacteriaceae bacterium YJPT1-3]